MHPVDAACAWTRADFPERREWTRPLEQRHITEIAAAVRAARRAGLRAEEIGSDAFPLPTAADLLRASRKDLETGPGFAVIEGFPLEDFSTDECRVAFAGICSHLGQVSVQGHTGEKIIDVVDRDRPYDHTSRGYHSPHRLPFHTDGADCVGLLCLETAMQGGTSLIASASAVHNAILAERPDLWRVLNRGFRHHRRGEEPPGEEPISARVAVFGFHDDLFHCMYNRNPIEWAADARGGLEPAEREALDYLDGVIERPENQLEMDLQRGDMQFLNNFVTLHSRTAYEDTPDRRRHMLRIWIAGTDRRRAGPTLLELYLPSADGSAAGFRTTHARCRG